MQDMIRQGAVILLLFAGVMFTVRLGFFQFRPPFLWLKNTMGSLFGKGTAPRGGGQVSPFQSVCTALAATMGTGNIAGAATAITMGGPGAVFWMWVSALLGMATSFAENVLGCRYARAGRAGPMAYLQEGLHSPVLANFYALVCLLGSFGMGNLCQTNSIALAMESAYQIPRLQVGVLLALCTAAVVMGGVKSIASFAEKAVPVMAAFYLFGCTAVVLWHLPALPGALGLIFREAFNFRAGVGGVAGYGVATALRTGVLRGIFSNEAGLGTSVMAHAPAKMEDPVQQGLWGMFEVFADTIVVCTMTALAVLASGVYDVERYSAAGGERLPTGAVLTGNAFATVFGAAGPQMLAWALLLFAFTTIVAWCSYGIQCIGYISPREGAVFAYKTAFICAIVPAAILPAQGIWETADVLNSLLAYPNLIALLLLSRQVLAQKGRLPTSCRNAQK